MREVQTTGFVRSGTLRVAQTEACRREYDRAVGMARVFGSELISTKVHLKTVRMLIGEQDANEMMRTMREQQTSHRCSDITGNTGDLEEVV